MINSPCLELGASLDGHSVKDLILDNSIEYFSTDINQDLPVDFVVDFENTEQIRDVFNNKKFNSIIVANVLEHTYNPIIILNNVFSLLNKNGIVVM